jgi:hypothetical protein
MPTDDTALVVTTPASVELGTLRGGTPRALVAAATEAARTLADLVRAQKLSVRISGREYVRCEGWTTLGAMLGVTPREVTTTEVDGVFTAVVELVRLVDGAIVSRASAECGEEKPWCDRPRYARRSMAQTRAAGKACRLAFSWIMALAGYECTPAEEMPPDASSPAVDAFAPREPTPAQKPRHFPPESKTSQEERAFVDSLPKSENPAPRGKENGSTPVQYATEAQRARIRALLDSPHLSPSQKASGEKALANSRLGMKGAGGWIGAAKKQIDEAQRAIDPSDADPGGPPRTDDDLPF